MFVGCHVSIAGGIWNAPKNAADLKCEVMQIFTRSPQGGPAAKLTEKTIQLFKKSILSEQEKIFDFYIHTPYYINFASLNNRIRHGSAGVVRDELERGCLLGARCVITHLGSAKDLGEKKGTEEVVKMIRKTLDGYSGETKLLIENSAGAGAIIGDDFREIKKILDGVGSSSIEGVCLDTQHSFASGYDWRDFEENINRIDKELGVENIKLIHANDSQSDCGSRKDRHEHIGRGKIGQEAFQKIILFARENGINLICETDWPGVEKDIALLKKMRENSTSRN